MSRIPTPTSIAAAPAASQASLESVEKQLGSVPNMFRLIANSPAGLTGYLGLNGALSNGSLPAATRERIALAVAQINDCDYCLAAHSYLGENLARLTPAEITANRQGYSTDARADVAVRFAVEIARNRGQVADDAVSHVLNAGFSNAEVVEIIAHVALNTFTNYVNEVLGTEIDFPEVTPLAA